MVSLVASTPLIRRSWPCGLARIWRRLDGCLGFSSSLLQFRSYSDQKEDGLPPILSPSCLEAPSTAPLSGESPPATSTPTSTATSTTQPFQSHKLVYDRHACPVRTSKGYWIKNPKTILEFRPTRATISDAERQVTNHDFPSRTAPEKSNRQSPSQSFVCDKELVPIASALNPKPSSLHLASATTPSQAIAALKSRQQQGRSIDSYTLIDALKQCSEQKDLTATRQVHDCINQTAMHKHPYVMTTLLTAYIKCGSLQDARLVFDGLLKTDRKLFTWNLMIGAYARNGLGVEAYHLFLQMNREGFIPNTITCLSILNASASAGALEWVKDVHSHIVKAGLISNVRVGTALVHMYARSGSISEARQVFDRMEKKDVITWNVMIGAYSESGCGVEAYHVYLRMRREGFIPDAFTYESALNAAASKGAVNSVEDVHTHSIKAGLKSDVRLNTALVRMYAKVGSLDAARLLFDDLEKRNSITWNVMIGAYAESGNGVEAFRLYGLMKRDGFPPDGFTFASILNSAASEGALEWVKEVHSDALKAGLDSDLRVGSALVHMYARIGSIPDARQVFDRMEKRDIITWNVMIGAHAESGCPLEAYQLFLQMTGDGFIPDAFTYASILNTPPSGGALEWVKEVHSHAIKAGLESNVRVGNALVHIYARSGSIHDARLVFDRMEKRDIITWNVMIGGLAQHGRGREALELFKRMSAESIQPDGSTFVAILSACSHSGLVDDGRRLFAAMEQEYGVEATVVHYNCMVDVLGRAGLLEEAKRLIYGMPMEPNAVTWKALLGGCRTHCNVGLGELAAVLVVRLEPKDSAAYVLLSNIYAATGMWEKVVSVRKRMQENGVRKEPGRSWISVDGKIHEFVAGDRSHPEVTAIYSLLQGLTEQLKGTGYIPDTRLVLQNINDEDKELVVCSHSEKLAIAYGLLRVPLGEVIRVEKNLRICSDCHAATKLISEVTGREIIAKDANRFHHFKDGVCSCGDYW